MSVVADILEAQANVPKVFQAGYEEGAKSGAGTQYVNQYFSNALVGKASGKAVSFETSPIEHEMGVKVERENLIPYPYTTKDTNIEGISFTYNGRTVVVEGESGATPIVNFEFGNVELEAGTYTIGGFSLHVGADPEFIQLNVEDSATGDNIITSDIGNIEDYKGTFVLSEKTNVKIWIRFEDTSSHGTMTPYLIKEDISGVRLLRYGKNLISSGLWGSLFEKQEDGSYKATTAVRPSTSRADVHLPSGVYTISYAEKSPINCNYRIAIKYVDDSVYEPKYVSSGEYKDFSITTNGKAIKQIYWTYGALSSDVYFKNLQIEANGVATEYEPYTEPTEYTPNEDGTVEGVMSVYPVTTLMIDTDGVTIDATYNKDANKVVASLEERIAALETAIVSQ